MEALQTLHEIYWALKKKKSNSFFKEAPENRANFNQQHTSTQQRGKRRTIILNL